MNRQKRLKKIMSEGRRGLREGAYHDLHKALINMDPPELLDLMSDALQVMVDGGSFDAATNEVYEVIDLMEKISAATSTAK